MEFDKMNPDLWQYLPAEIMMINILPRLPIRSIIHFKRVCKSWLDLIESRKFCDSHLCNSNSIPGLAFFDNHSKQCHFMSLDEHEHEQVGPKCHFSIALKFCLPTQFEHVDIRDTSVNGLLLFSDTRIWPVIHVICNPITREYITLPPSLHGNHYQSGIGIGFGFGFGFGVSKMSGEYKMVKVFSTKKCEVYTLGTGSWRSVPPCSYDHLNYTATFVNGNLHWPAYDRNANSYRLIVGISCFDLETELFTNFSPPPPNSYGIYSGICALEERLAFFDYAAPGFVIWLMNEYGDDKSWTRKFFITSFPVPNFLNFEMPIPIKVFKEGDILIVQLRHSRRLYYFKKTSNIIEFCNLPSGDCITNPINNYTPSFLSLKTFSAENVRSF